MPQLLISDANILIDMECGDLLGRMFQLAYDFAVPDVLFEEELRADHEFLIDEGLQVLELQPEGVARVVILSSKYRNTGVSRNDLFALALAIQEKCPLLTGDEKLRDVCESENSEVHGTLWLIKELFDAGLMTYAEIVAAYDAMKAQNRRLPWAEVTKQLRQMQQP